MRESQKLILKTLSNSIARTKRRLDKAKKFFYPNVEELENQLVSQKEKLKNLKQRYV